MRLSSMGKQRPVRKDLAHTQRAGWRNFRPRLERLEERLAPAAFAVTNTLDDGSAGSLRWAINQSNADADPLSTINFNIPGSGTQTISPTSPLPALTHPAVLDGTTQPGYSGTPLIELDGENAASSGVYGFVITSSGSTIRGFVINRFSSEAIAILGSAAVGNVIEGNFIGTNAAGTAALANLADGILIDLGAANNTIGGTTAAAANVISGNTRVGVVIAENGAAPNVVEGNYIGTDRTGTASIANGWGGILIRNSGNNTIGGTIPGAGNLVSGNGGNGVTITGSGTTGNFVEGNYIGTDVTGRGLIPGAVSWYKAEGNANDSVGGNNGTLKGNVTFAPGMAGQAFNFDASTSTHVEVPATASLEPQNLTVEAWANARSVGSWVDQVGPIVVSKDLPSSASQISYTITGPGTTGQFSFQLSFTDGSKYRLFSNDSFAFNVFHHVALTWDGSTLLGCVDGVLEGQVAIGPKTIAYDTTPLSIGSHELADIRRFDGLIDEVGIYNRALSATEVQSIFAAGNLGKGNAAGTRATASALRTGPATTPLAARRPPPATSSVVTQATASPSPAAGRRAMLWKATTSAPMQPAALRCQTPAAVFAWSLAPIATSLEERLSGPATWFPGTLIEVSTS